MRSARVTNVNGIGPFTCSSRQSITAVHGNGGQGMQLSARGISDVCEQQGILPDRSAVVHAGGMDGGRETAVGGWGAE